MSNRTGNSESSYARDILKLKKTKKKILGRKKRTDPSDQLRKIEKL